MVNNALVPRNNIHPLQRRGILEIAADYGLTAWNVQNVIQAVEQGRDLYNAIQPYLPDGETLANFRNRANNVLQQLDEFTQNVMNDIEQNQPQYTEEQLAQIRQDLEINDMEQEDRLSTIQREVEASETIFTGTFISQFARWIAHNQLKNKKQMTLQQNQWLNGPQWYPLLDNSEESVKKHLSLFHDPLHTASKIHTQPYAATSNISLYAILTIKPVQTA